MSTLGTTIPGLAYHTLFFAVVAILYFAVPALGEAISLCLRVFTKVTKKSTAWAALQVHPSLRADFILGLNNASRATVVAAPLTNGQTLITVVKFAVLALYVDLGSRVLALSRFPVVAIWLLDFQLVAGQAGLRLDELQITVLLDFVVQSLHGFAHFIHIPY